MHIGILETTIGLLSCLSLREHLNYYTRLMARRVFWFSALNLGTREQVSQRLVPGLFDTDRLC